MRTVKFSDEELIMIKEITFLGNSQYDNDFPAITKLILNKIRIEIFQFSSKEIQVLKSYTSNWINENEELISQLAKKYLSDDNDDYVDISIEEKEIMRKIDRAFSIKSKLFKEKYLSFKRILDKCNLQ